MWSRCPRRRPSAATAGATYGSSIPAMKAASSRTSIAEHSAMPTPRTRVARAAALRRLPSQSGHGRCVEIRSTAARMCFCRLSSSLLRYRRWSFGIRPSYLRFSDFAPLPTLIFSPSGSYSSFLRCSGV